ncbi:MAG: metal-dependent hydrolase [Plesiomonas sp.]|uniref:metal-dependent hydrolase n=3 Tax=Plesiomonas sp. TaxID=2486279 RepID=UPI003EE65DF5
MTAQGHLLFSVACIVLAKKAGLTPELIQLDWWHAVPAALATALLPDIDHPRSVLGQKLRWISIPISKIFGHRGFTHSLLAVAIGLWCLLHKWPTSIPIPPGVIDALVIGYMSHLLGDALTPAGIPLFWPVKQRFRLPLLRFRTGSNMETIVCVILLAGSLWWKH